jgi:hypothetical protein
MEDEGRRLIRKALRRSIPFRIPCYLSNLLHVRRKAARP